ncbi:MAG: proton extrusion protein PcxA [Okeania sp. SIO2H7]|nr:proton extrusion protein PcxA [Okeania sp. SIO2H7]
MSIDAWNQIKMYLLDANLWFGKTPEKALEEAYNEAVAIASIEKDYFNGKKISPEFGDYSDSVQSYFNSELEKSLKNIETRLTEFNASRLVVNAGRKKKLKFSELEPERASIILKKLEFIDEITSKYKAPQSLSSVIVDVPTTSEIISSKDKKRLNLTQFSTVDSSKKKTVEALKEDKPETSFLPRSLLGTFKRIKKELDPAAEEEVLKKFRKSKVKTIVSIRFILLLILVPLLVHQISKIAVVGPIVENFIRPPEAIQQIFINEDLEEEALMELQKYGDRLEFEVLIGKRAKIEPEEKKELLEEKAEEIAEEYYQRSSNAIENIFCDLISIFAFGLIIVSNKKEVEIFKSFMDELIYGLSDSAKAFIIILLTDMFVGFHSPHGWEVILASVARHFGLPENKEFNFLFIATFPVILDAVFKYWIFRYLNRSSPSAVATYKNMNE